jgi:hypothetical protein
MFNNAVRGSILILLIVGVAFVSGGIMAGQIAGGFDRAAERIEKLTPATTMLLMDSLPGREVLVEGQISRHNPAQLRTFMVYIWEKYRPDSDSSDDDDDSAWIEQERVTPPLLLELAGGGPVRIENSDYSLSGAKIIYDGDELRYQVFEGGDPVIAVGVLTSNDEPPRMAAEFIARGTKAEYVADQRGMASGGRRFGGIFMGLGGIFVVGALALGFRSWWTKVHKT